MAGADLKSELDLKSALKSALSLWWSSESESKGMALSSLNHLAIQSLSHTNRN